MCNQLFELPKKTYLLPCCHEPINALVKTAVRIPYILPSFKRQPADNKIQVALVALLAAAITHK
ncbi:hypothetical protein TRIATDRAFT_299323 [Trichoderma atroviride IMI 206040]|uniref:Uncharacterized protein n=1 Tax=Hypocrea atroviridis (strain ATCC 20476 / IMI 206040) TaxID=452589 RepID=G9NU78_HYPAI|nr:uncharacterized protein TRIATDRAFT_299323 [Trichoderma atroviride IMI 206040]EHK45611.1 hypothetical protein TRIATDRAFT_299323 [Trichoderma atroviride IMI 206040]